MNTITSNYNIPRQTFGFLSYFSNKYDRSHICAQLGLLAPCAVAGACMGRVQPGEDCCSVACNMPDTLLVPRVFRARFNPVWRIHGLAYLRWVIHGSSMDHACIIRVNYQCADARALARKRRLAKQKKTHKTLVVGFPDRDAEQFRKNPNTVISS